MKDEGFLSNGFNNHYDRDTSMPLYPCLDSRVRVELSKGLLIEYMINECIISSRHRTRQMTLKSFKTYPTYASNLVTLLFLLIMLHDTLPWAAMQMH